MKPPRLTVICRGYVLLLLLAAVFLSPVPYSIAAFVLLLATLYVALRPGRAGIAVAASVAAMLVVPLVMAPALALLVGTGTLSSAGGGGSFGVSALTATSVAVAAPALYLLDGGLVGLAAPMAPALAVAGRRRLTRTAAALLVTVLAMAAVAVVAESSTLLLADGALLLYIIGGLGAAARRTTGSGVTIPAVEKRVLAGDSAHVTLEPLGRASSVVHCSLEADDEWVRPRRTGFPLNGTSPRIPLTVAPPLSGPARPLFRITVTDRRGLLLVGQEARPVHLHVIPRARYARWLTERYLERTGPAASGESALSETFIPRGRGIEYMDSRSYEPGDELRRVDWKHTVKLNRLTIREFAEIGGQTAILAVNLTVADLEEADRLSEAMLTAALGLAEADAPSALAVYDLRGIIASTGTVSPREALTRIMALTGQVMIEDLGHRVLQQADPAKLRRSIVRLAEAASAPAAKLRGLLEFELGALERAAARHPATQVLLRCAGSVSPPATVVLVSLLNHDRDAIAVTLEKLAGRGFGLLRAMDGVTAGLSGSVRGRAAPRLSGGTIRQTD